MTNRNGQTQRRRSNTAATVVIESIALALPQINRLGQEDLIYVVFRAYTSVLVLAIGEHSTVAANLHGNNSIARHDQPRLLLMRVGNSGANPSQSIVVKGPARGNVAKLL